ALLLQALGRAPQVLVILEGKADYQALDPLWAHFGLRDKVLPVTSGGGGWHEIVDSAKALREGLERFRLRTDVFVLLDGNGDTPAKEAYLSAQGFAGDRSHVWSQKEIESYLPIPTALHKISGVPLEGVREAIDDRPGTAGKDRLEKVLDALGIKGTANNVIVKNALANCPQEIPPELMEVPQKIRRMLGLPPT
ncbi:MAG TPA: hypothetical protein VK881_02475, partial [bacterium]|nr:hypothetical protein [bacterium]